VTIYPGVYTTVVQYCNIGKMNSSSTSADRPPVVAGPTTSLVSEPAAVAIATSNGVDCNKSAPPSACKSKSVELLNSTGMGDLTVAKSYKRETKNR